MKSLKKIYSSLYKKNQLKEVYNNLFELRAINQDKDLNSNSLKVKQRVLIPGLGTFELSKFKTALIALVIEYYYGEKSTVELLTDLLFGFLKLENDKKKKEHNPVNEDRVIKFLELCNDESIDLLDENYNLTSNIKEKYLGAKEIDSMFNRGAGLLFEIIILEKIKQQGYKTNFDEEFIRNVGDHKITKFVFTILDVIYLKGENLTEDEIKSLFNKDLTEDRLNSLKDPENPILSFEFDMLEDLVEKDIHNDESVKKNICFEYPTEGPNYERPLDLIVKNLKTGNVLSILDIKSSETKSEIDEETKIDNTEYKDIRAVSTNKERVNGFLGKIYQENPNQKDISIGLLRVYYEFTETQIVVLKTDCLYFSANQNHEDVYINNTKEYYIRKDLFIDRIASKELNTFPITNKLDTFNLNKKTLLDKKKLDIAVNAIKDSIIKAERGGLVNRRIRDGFYSKNPAYRDEIIKSVILLKKYHTDNTIEYRLNDKQIQTYNSYLAAFEKYDDRENIVINRINYIVSENLKKDLISKAVNTISDYILNSEDRKGNPKTSINTAIRKYFKRDLENNNLHHKTIMSLRKKIVEKIVGLKEQILQSSNNNRKILNYNHTIDKFFQIQKNFNEEKHSTYYIGDHDYSNAIKNSIKNLEELIEFSANQIKKAIFNQSQTTINRKINYISGRENLNIYEHFFKTFNFSEYDISIAKVKVKNEIFKLKEFHYDKDNIFTLDEEQINNYNFAIKCFEEADNGVLIKNNKKERVNYSEHEIVSSADIEAAKIKANKEAAKKAAVEAKIEAKTADKIHNASRTIIAHIMSDNERANRNLRLYIKDPQNIYIKDSHVREEIRKNIFKLKTLHEDPTKDFALNTEEIKKYNLAILYFEEVEEEEGKYSKHAINTNFTQPSIKRRSTSGIYANIKDKIINAGDSGKLSTLNNYIKRRTGRYVKSNKKEAIRKEIYKLKLDHENGKKILNPRQIKFYNKAIDCFEEVENIGKEEQETVSYSDYKIDESSMRLEDLILEVYSYIYNKQK